jgi:eukaryotic-like serine/threonine-protein kinase
VAFASSRSGGLDIYQRPSNASGPDQPLLKLNGQPIVFPSDWSSDGRFLAYYRTDPKTQLDIWVLPLAGDQKPIPFLRGDFNESQAQFSPDARWIAYVSDESGASEVYVQSFPTLTGKWQISTGGGTEPRWRRDGRELFYLAPDRKLMSVIVKAGATFEADAPRALFEPVLPAGALRQTYSVSSDGQRFLLNTPLEGPSPSMTLVINWPALLKK